MAVFFEAKWPQWLFYQPEEWPLYQSRNGHGVKADARFTTAGKPQWPFYQQWQLYQGLAS